MIKTESLSSQIHHPWIFSSLQTLRDSFTVSQEMMQIRMRSLWLHLQREGKYTVTPDMKAQLSDFYGNYTSEKETAEVIKKLYEDTGYIIDTHTAVAAGVYDKYKEATGDTATKTVIASTASPFKFTRSVMDAIDPKYDSMTDFELVDELSKLGKVKVPNAIEEIRDAKILHNTVCDVDQMENTVKKMLGVQ